MDKKYKFQILIAIFTTIITIILSPFFSWLYGYLFNTLDPVIILYAVLSTVFSILFIFPLIKIFFVLGNKIINKYNDFFYWKEIDGLIENIEKQLKNREIYVIKKEDLAQYIEKQNKIYKKSDESTYFNYSIKISTNDCMERMVEKKILFDIPTLRVLILNEILICKICDGNIKILDLVDRVEINCEQCNQAYYIDSNGYGMSIKNDMFGTQHKIIYRLKNPNRKMSF
ncbi:hypothetical protein LCGC14_3014390 [marine sediment metagenome]|uniref:Uncharacterized protein n=1 Tax=marine sediment metagenome TaxID=412755 RepID=A0A0F8WX79_9ZZZZ